MMKRILLLLVFLTGFSGATGLYAQRPPSAKKPIKWGEIPPEHLAMDHYAPDSNAAAVILADFGDVHFTASIKPRPVDVVSVDRLSLNLLRVSAVAQMLSP